MDIISVHNLTKKYGDFTAVDGISFSVGSGETFGILGPNGAGKTTTLEMIEGLKGITTGTAMLDGHDVQRETRMVKSLIGVQLQASSFFDGLNLKELLVTFAALYGRSVDPMKLLHDVQLQEKWKSQVKELSEGQKQRLSIAVALVNDPKVLFLDEPTTGLDPQARRNMWDLVTSIKHHGTTIVVTTHYMEEAEVLCDRVAIMDHAKIVALDSPRNLLQLAEIESTIEFRVTEPIDPEPLRQLPDVAKVTSQDHGYVVLSKDPEKTLPALFELEQRLEFNMFDLQLRQATLEDVFLTFTGRSLRE